MRKFMGLVGVIPAAFISAGSSGMRAMGYAPIKVLVGICGLFGGLPEPEPRNVAWGVWVFGFLPNGEDAKSGGGVGAFGVCGRIACWGLSGVMRGPSI